MSGNENEKLIEFDDHFRNWVLKDIRIILNLEDKYGNILEPDRSAYTHRRPLVAAVILICCAIDCLARYRYGCVDGRHVGNSFKNFIKDYFNSATTFSGKNYDCEDIYNGLRNTIVHGYSLGCDLGLVHQSNKEHLSIVGTRVIIDVFSLYFDLEKAYEKYTHELSDGQHLEEFCRRWLAQPLMQYIPDENIKGVR